MPIDTISPRLREVGRLRCGDAKGTKGAPRRLQKFRLTSGDKDGLEAFAKLYGGKVESWDSPGEDRWELYTAASEIEVLVIPGQFDQTYEMYSAAGRQRACTGLVCTLPDRSEVPCVCNEEFAGIDERIEAEGKGKACKPITRVNLIIVDWFGLFGSWRFQTGSYRAAQQVKAVMNGLEMAGARKPVPAIISIVSETKKVPGQPPNHFSYPVISLGTQQVRGMLLDAAGVTKELPAGQPLDPSGPRLDLPSPSEASTEPQATDVARGGSKDEPLGAPAPADRSSEPVPSSLMAGLDEALDAKFEGKPRVRAAFKLKLMEELKDATNERWQKAIEELRA